MDNPGKILLVEDDPNDAWLASFSRLWNEPLARARPLLRRGAAAFGRRCVALAHAVFYPRYPRWGITRVLVRPAFTPGESNP